MALPAGAVWEIRPTGDDSNGALFYASQPSAGTDYSQQNAAQLSITDAVTVGTTTVTSVTAGFTALMVGNGINIAGTPYMIATFVNATTITVDRTIGAAIGQTAKVGGAAASPGFVSGQAVTANKVWLKAGTYTLGSVTANIATGTVASPGGSAGNPFVWEGYQTTRGDKGTKPVFSDGGLGGGGIDFFDCANAFVIVDNISLLGTGVNNALFNIRAASVRLIRCKAAGANYTYFLNFANIDVIFCEAIATGSRAGFHCQGAGTMVSCVSHGGGGHGFVVAGTDTVAFESCLAFGNTGSGFNSGAALQVAYKNCTSDNNGVDGFVMSSAGGAAGIHALNCISTNNAGKGFNCAAASGYVMLINCATYNNTGGAVSTNLTNTEGAVVLSGTPYVSAPTNYGLNATAGAGAACRAAGTPGAFPGLASTIAYPDLGAVQHQDGGGSSGILYVPNLAGV